MWCRKIFIPNLTASLGGNYTRAIFLPTIPFVYSFKFFLFHIIKKECYNTMRLSRHEKACLSGLRFEGYLSHHRAKYLSKRNPLKHTCLWRDKLIVLWILNRQAKIFLHIRKSVFTIFDNFSLIGLPNSSLEENSREIFSNHNWIITVSVLES